MKFRLRTKLILISVVLIIIPFSGYQYLLAIEQHLKTASEQSLSNTAAAVATIMQTSPELFAYNRNILQKGLNANSVYIRESDNAVQLDGYADDWLDHIAHTSRYPQSVIDNTTISFEHVAISFGDYIYALFIVKDDKIVYRAGNSLRLDQSDHLQIAFTDPEGELRYFLLTTRAPGWVNAHSMSGNRNDPYPGAVEPRIKGEWQETRDGYVIEIRMPAAMIGQKLGFAIADVDDTKSRTVEQVVGTADMQNAETLGDLLRPSPEINRLLEAFKDASARVWIINSQKHVLGIAGSLNSASENDKEKSLLRGIMHWVFSLFLEQPTEQFIDELSGASRLSGEEISMALSGNATAKWRRTIDNKALIASYAYPVTSEGNIIGAVIAEQTANPIFALQNDAFENLLMLSIISFLTTVLFLLLLASQLSRRITRLSRESDTLINDDGKLSTNLKETSESDEIGDLRNNFRRLVTRLQGYTLYLETLSAKLSHEIRTPIAIVKSSLENLKDDSLADESKQYLSRANAGMERLSKIVNNLSEARQLEAAMQNEDKSFFQLDTVVRNCVEGYQQAYTQQPFEIQTATADMMIYGSADLIAQMLDKLIENARQFSAPGTSISVNLDAQEKLRILRVRNSGPMLPENMENQLFDQLVSIREKKSTQLHLGLGLYIVKLIAEFHHAQVSAQNLDDGSGVEFSVIFHV